MEKLMHLLHYVNYVKGGAGGNSKEAQGRVLSPPRVTLPGPSKTFTAGQCKTATRVSLYLGPPRDPTCAGVANMLGPYTNILTV
jgi:hypothetical protein